MKARFDIERRRIVFRGARIAGLVAATTVAGVVTCVASKASKSELMYQDHRHDGKGCADCKFFSPTASAGDLGQCSVVDGVVKRDGWCLAFSPNSSP
jgi:hypothetical protein